MEKEIKKFDSSFVSSELKDESECKRQSLKNDSSVEIKCYQESDLYSQREIVTFKGQLEALPPIIIIQEE